MKHVFTGRAGDDFKEAYAHIYGLNDTHACIEGRCVRLGQTTDVPPAYYHWLVARMDRELVVDEFWAAEM